MQDEEKPKKRFEVLRFILFVVPFAVIVLSMFLYFVETFSKMGLLGYFFSLVVAVGFIFFVCDQFNRNPK